MKKLLLGSMLLFTAACGVTQNDENTPAGEPSPVEHAGHLEDELGTSEQGLHSHKYCGGPYYYCRSSDNRWVTYKWCCSGHAYAVTASASCNVPR